MGAGEPAGEQSGGSKRRPARAFRPSSRTPPVPRRRNGLFSPESSPDRPGSSWWRGRAQGGAGGAPVAVQGGGVSESVAKAPRAGIGREKKRGIPTIPFARLGSIRAFATDSDNRCRRGSPGGAPRVGRRPRREPPAPRRALRTRECSSNRCSRRQNARLESKMRISTRKGPAAVIADHGAGPAPEHLQ